MFKPYVITKWRKEKKNQIQIHLPSLHKQYNILSFHFHETNIAIINREVILNGKTENNRFPFHRDGGTKYENYVKIISKKHKRHLLHLNFYLN